ncbi:MAG: signal peptidase I [Byssovorax sp.]
MRKLLRAILWIGGIAFVIGLVLRTLVFDLWTIPDDPKLAASIAPTLRAGDRVLLMKRGEIGFGSLVRCRNPQDETQLVVARIAGLQGDSLDIDGKQLLVNGVPYNGETACPKPTYTIEHPVSGEPIELFCDRVAIGGGWHYRAYSKKRLFAQPKSVAKVGEDMLYLLSDDRDYHDDSRDFGPVPRQSCKGPIVFRLWGKEGFFKDPLRFEVIH